MEKDRKMICAIISEMLDNPDENGIYPTTIAFAKLETYIGTVRFEAVGWAYADCYATMDKGEDPRKKDMSNIIERIQKDLSK